MTDNDTLPPFGALGLFQMDVDLFLVVEGPGGVVEKDVLDQCTLEYI